MSLKSQAVSKRQIPAEDTVVSYATAPAPVRPDLIESHVQTWQRLAKPGTWWTGAERVAIAAEVRNARRCPLCKARKAALSASAVQGEHDSLGTLPDAVVEVIHRVTTDPARLSEKWYHKLLDSGLQDVHYVETIGVVVRTVSVDTFCRGIGVAPHPLPSPVAGQPTRRRPQAAKLEEAWVPMIPNGEATEPDADLYEGRDYPNIGRALSLVPDEVRGCFHELVPAQYVQMSEVGDPAYDPGRAISRPQMELIAGRVSALNECFY